jgi:long-chain fatty acid transport protein
MKAAYQLKRAVCAVGTSALAIAAAAGTASAGGFDVREQSALFQGMSFAGAAAGGTALSSMFWNPAAAGYVGQGITMDSSYSLILPRADVTVESIDLDGAGGNPPLTPPFGGPFAGLDRSVDFGRDAVVPASYMAYRYNDDLVFAMSINSQFGLGTKPDSFEWAGDVLGRTSKLFSVNAAPTVAYQIAPGVQIGAGLQVQFIDLMRFRTATGVPGGPSSTLEGDDFGFGYTLGLNLTPAAGTSIGIGFRSSIRHELEGKLKTPGPSFPISADLELPEKVTASLTQALMPDVRAHATVEWTNWSRLGVIPVDGAPVDTNLAFQWEDGWYFAVGGEYDYSADLTLRAGFAYEISPIDDPSSRLVQLPDNDRYWLSAGASYKVGDLMGLMKDASIDLAYTHIFVKEGDFEREPATGGPVFTGSTDSAVDIISIGLRSKL